MTPQCEVDIEPDVTMRGRIHVRCFKMVNEALPGPMVDVGDGTEERFLMCPDHLATWLSAVGIRRHTDGIVYLMSTWADA